MAEPGIPFSRAHTTACDLECTLILAYMRATWLRTVWWDTPSSSAMALSVMPMAMRASTCCSRGVSSGLGSVWRLGSPARDRRSTMFRLNQAASAMTSLMALLTSSCVRLLAVLSMNIFMRTFSPPQLISDAEPSTSSGEPSLRITFSSRSL
jgi:hypothetical protein